MSDRHKSLERLEARIDEMVSAIDWWRKESARLEQEAFKAGFQYGERHGKGLPGAWFTDYEHTYLRWKHHLNGPKPDETPEINHDNGAAQAWESTARGAASDVIAMAKTLREIAKRCEGEQDSGYGYIHGIATAALQITGGAALTRRSEK